MLQVVRTAVTDIFNGRDRAYIYVWLSKDAGAVYVGQTNKRLGSFGRGYEHLLPDGQLRCRMDEKFGYEPEAFHDFWLTSYLLPISPEFIGPETAYREAVEYLVQLTLIDRRDDVTPSYRVISWVRPNERVREPLIQQLARQISNDFISQYASS